MTAKVIKLTPTLMAFFGRLPGESLIQFNDETKALTQQDKIELCDMIAAEEAAGRLAIGIVKYA